MSDYSDASTQYVALAFFEAEQRFHDQQNPHLPPRLRQPLPASGSFTKPVRLMFN